MNLPNKLTLLRIIMIPVFVAVFYITAVPYGFMLSAIIFALAALTDFFDGKIARKYNLVTDFGKFLDPIADKVLVSTALIISLVPPTGVVILPFGFVGAILVATILAREFIISGFRLVASNKNIVISADKTGKIKTFFTDLTILLMLITAQFSFEGNGVLNYVSFGCLIVSALLTIISGVSYLVKNKQVIASK